MVRIPTVTTGYPGLLICADGEIWVSKGELDYDWGSRRH